MPGNEPAEMACCEPGIEVVGAARRMADQDRDGLAAVELLDGILRMARQGACHANAKPGEADEPSQDLVRPHVSSRRSRRHLVGHGRHSASPRAITHSRSSLERNGISSMNMVTACR